MNPAETTKLLTFMAGLDPRLSPRDDREAKMRIVAWSTVLQNIDYEDAKRFVTRYYSTDQQWPIQIGSITSACKPTARWEEKTEHQQLAGRAVPMPDDVRDLLGRDPLVKAARRVPCPWLACKASAGQPCNLPSGRLHPSRMAAGAVAA